MTVSNRHLSKLGQLPGDPASITSIDARENKFREIPPEVVSLTNLDTLVLDRNEITGLCEGTLKKMRSLKKFSVQVCMLAKS